MLPYFKGYLQQILSKEDMVVTWRFGSTLWGIYIFTSFISAKQKDLHKVIQYFNYFFKCKSRIYMWKFFEISQPKNINPGFSPQAYPRLKLRSSKFFSNNIEIQNSICSRGYSFPSISRWKIFFQQRNVWRYCLYIYVPLNKKKIYTTRAKKYSQESLIWKVLYYLLSTSLQKCCVLFWTEFIEET